MNPLPKPGPVPPRSSRSGWPELLRNVKPGEGFTVESENQRNNIWHAITYHDIDCGQWESYKLNGNGYVIRRLKPGEKPAWENRKKK